MQNRKYFARNADGSLKRKEPCKTEGCGYPNYHVCLYGKEDTTPAIFALEAIRGKRKLGAMSEDHKARIAEAQRERHARERIENYPRDMRIQEDYANGMTKPQLINKYKLSRYKIDAALTNSRSECML